MKINFDNEQLILLNKSIMELPYREAAPLINHINAELKAASESEKSNDGDKT